MTNSDPMFAAVRDFTHHVLQSPMSAASFEWTVQGFGMLRCYLQPDKRFRLNIWDSRLKVPHVSVIHDHPWHLQSWVLSGRMGNIRYHEQEKPETYGTPFHWMEIQTGIEAGAQIATKQTMWLWQHPFESYQVGETYKQTATEIHQSVPDDGCVTINSRERVGTGDRARVFWELGSEWVDAKPRLATRAEVLDTCALALEGWS